jgi:hypothetical protein
MAGGFVGVAMPGELRLNGHLIDTKGSKVSLRCMSANAKGFSLPSQLRRPDGRPLLWRLPMSEGTIATCSGTVTVVRGVSEQMFTLLPWTIAHQ